jgi:hypothetical protein
MNQIPNDIDYQNINPNIINNNNIITNNNDMQNIFVDSYNKLMNYIDRNRMRDYLLAEMKYYIWLTSPENNNDAYGELLIEELNQLRNINFTNEMMNILNNILNDFHLLNVEQKKLMINYISSLFRN